MIDFVLDHYVWSSIFACTFIVLGMLWHNAQLSTFRDNLSSGQPVMYDNGKGKKLGTVVDIYFEYVAVMDTEESFVVRVHNSKVYPVKGGAV